MHINEMLCELLGHKGYATAAAYSGTEALLMLPHDKYALVLLDLMLPGKTGEEVLQEVRLTHDIPVIVLTAKMDKETTVDLLQRGADDYLTKPFDNNELLARIAVQLRRVATPGLGLGAADSNLGYKDMTLDMDSHDAFINGTKAGLSKREFEILKLMVTHPQKVFTKNNLYESVWGDEFFGTDNTVNMHISRLRAKLNALNPQTEYIKTVWGIGFKMED
ncbi:MAG: response regulator transcription factor [Defluviitaleaceae bacterium]|nr:response regulator transcription factor [Defluviitaleaceae bacterium]